MDRPKWTTLIKVGCEKNYEGKRGSEAGSRGAAACNDPREGGIKGSTPYTLHPAPYTPHPTL